MAAGAPTGQRARITALVEPVVAAAGYDLEELVVVAAGRRSLVKVVVDGDGGITLDDIAEVSRAVSAVLDDADAEGGIVGKSPYTLEVTSRGVDRPLTLPRHWSRNVSRLVKVQIGDESVTGRISAATDSHVVLDVAGKPREVGYDRLGAGQVQVEFSRPGTPAGTESEDEITEGEDA